MRPTGKVLWALFLAMPFLILNVGNVSAETDDYTPEVTARVARISFVSGDVQIKRADQTDWERAAQNLPIVEGDEIATDAGARLEIQFDRENYLRLSANAYLKITTLRDEGIAVSLPNGSLSLRVLNFDKTRRFFEIDAPQTTVSIEQAGMYRVDAGGKNDAAVRVSVTDSGQARVFSENSGFTLKNGRRATIQLEGAFAGEWETSDAARYADEFDGWALQRDVIIAKRLQKADYDKYYDQDFYGAEELNEYGEWVYTKKYGYVWRPYRDSVSSYADWSPYRYGQWRWIPPYGWTWVNDEPWGWATYHHGRWVYESSNWYWTPYPQHRGRRSWWRPALVVISTVFGSICWYPLPYHYGYYNYNSYYTDRRRYNTTIINNTTVVVNPAPNPLPIPTTNYLKLTTGGILKKTIPAESVPAGGVVTVAASDFGRGKGRFRTADADVAIKVLSEAPSETVKPAALPTFKDLNGRVSREILPENPPTVRPSAQIKIGAIERTGGVSMGETLRKERIFGNRPPIENSVETPVRPENSDGMETQTPVRSTGAVKRLPRVEPPANEDAPVRPTLRNDDPRNNPVRPTGGNSDEESESSAPIKPQRGSNPRIVAPPVDATPREERIEKPQPRRERLEPVRPEPPRQEPREETPVRIEPPRERSPREEPVRQPPPPKREPQPEQKIAAPNKNDDRDGRR